MLDSHEPIQEGWRDASLDISLGDSCDFAFIITCLLDVEHVDSYIASDHILFLWDLFMFNSVVRVEVRLVILSIEDTFEAGVISVRNYG
jgi:hypothetical protein